MGRLLGAQAMTSPAISLSDAAVHLGWSRKTLLSALKRHRILTMGTGRRARLEKADLDLLKRRMAADEVQGVIYVVQGLPDTPVKIGFSRLAEVQLRVRVLQTGNPHPLRLIASVQSFRLGEMASHGVLSKYRLTGEWFGWQEPVKRFVASLQAGLTLEAALDAAKAAQ